MYIYIYIPGPSSLGTKWFLKGTVCIFGCRYLDKRKNMWHGIGIVIKYKCCIHSTLLS